MLTKAELDRYLSRYSDFSDIVKNIVKEAHDCDIENIISISVIGDNVNVYYACGVDYDGYISHDNADIPVSIFQHYPYNDNSAYELEWLEYQSDKKISPFWGPQEFKNDVDVYIKKRKEEQAKARREESERYWALNKRLQDKQDEFNMRQIIESNPDIAAKCFNELIKDVKTTV